MNDWGARTNSGGSDATASVAGAGAASMASPTLESVLSTLTGSRLLDLCRLFGCEVHDIAGGKDRLVRKLAESLHDRFLGA